MSSDYSLFVFYYKSYNLTVLSLLPDAINIYFFEMPT